MIDIGDQKIEMVDADRLVPNAWNPNSVGVENMEKLKKSLLSNKFFKPVLVRTNKDGELEIIGGAHRVEAAAELGIEVPILNLGNVSDTDAKKLTLMDNDSYGENDSTLLARVLQDLENEGVDILGEMTYDETSLNELLDLTVGTDDLDALDALDDLNLSDEKGDSSAPTTEEDANIHKAFKLRIDITEAEYFEDMIREQAAERHIEDSDPAVVRGLLFKALLEEKENS